MDNKTSTVLGFRHSQLPNPMAMAESRPASACVDEPGRIPTRPKSNKPYHMSPGLEIEPNEHSSQFIHIRNPLTNGAYYAASDIWVCCQCGDGPKVYTHSTQCVVCNHAVCESCTRVN
ncbi:hypothetical protein BDW71DRAFT_170602 [Aspergillus fruticulosus]